MEGSFWSSELMASWAEAIFNAAAVLTALYIYWKGRKDQRSDIEARRRVLHAMLEQHIVDVAMQITVRSNWHQENPLPIARINDWQGWVAGNQIDNLERLIELQVQLIAFGTLSDVKAAAFIEACRIFQRDVERLRKALQPTGEEFPTLDYWPSCATAASRSLLAAARAAGPLLPDGL